MKQFDNSNINRESGFTLVELSISLLILALVLTPAVALYMRYAEAQRSEQTRLSVENTNKAVGGFMALYGRYPCPADPTLPPTDPDYGYEEPTCNGGGVIEVNSVRAPALADDRVWIGAVPFRQLNLSEDDAIDGYGNRLTYAVTATLTDDGTFDPTIGGISILDVNNQSAITPPDSAHYFLYSASKRGDGAYTAEGVLGQPCPVGTRETENCDNDTTFRTGGRYVDFDDLTAFSTPLSISEWQFADPPNDNHMVLRRAIKFALGVDETDSLVGSSDIEVRAKGVDNGRVIVPSGEMLIQNQICDFAGANCMSPADIAGVGPTGGLYCSDYGGGYMVAVENNQLRCAPEIWMNCPTGSFLVGFDATGKIICDSEPAPGCLDQANVATTCGDLRDITGIYDGGWRFVYSGDCYMAPSPLDLTAVAAAPDIPTIQALVNAKNAEIRVPTDCGDSSATGQVRNTYTCNAGSWTGPTNPLERLNNTPFAGWGPTYSSSPAPAETTGPAYAAGTPMSADATNSDAYHDCWCREDYRVDLGTCVGAAATGNTVTIRHHDCPQTSHVWDIIYTTAAFCGCTATTTSQTTACHTYFGAASGTITGNVVRDYDVTCPGSVLVGPTATDISGCQCPAKTSPVITTSACPLGTTNSFTYNAVGYSDVERIYENTWSCPGGPAPQPATSAADAGSWSGATLVHTEPCVCDTALTKQVIEACPSGYLGPGLTYDVEWDCGIPGWEAKANWDLVSKDCSQCTWQKPSGAPSISGSSDALGVLIGGAGCTCGQIDMCRESAGGGLWDVYVGCTCTSF